MRVIWTEPAEDDLDAVFDHVARDAPLYAEALAERIVAATEVLAATPRIGRIVTEAGLETVRERIVQSQRIVYEIDDEQGTVSILALVHVRQDLAGREDKPWKKDEGPR